jgi:hypothetical protein
VNAATNNMDHPNFEILPHQKIAEAFLQLNIHNFIDACRLIGAWPYARNSNKNSLLAMFDEQCGTCSTKHALLKELANAHNFNDLQLMLGIFKMNDKNVPKIKGILKTHRLAYLPEAHCYLKYKNLLLDYTNTNAQPIQFLDDLLVETEIQPAEIGAKKVEFHKNYLQQWLLKNPKLPYDLPTIWHIREQCIQALSQ